VQADQLVRAGYQKIAVVIPHRRREDSFKRYHRETVGHSAVIACQNFHGVPYDVLYSEPGVGKEIIGLKTRLVAANNKIELGLLK